MHHRDTQGHPCPTRRELQNSTLDSIGPSDDQNGSLTRGLWEEAGDSIESGVRPAGYGRAVLTAGRVSPGGNGKIPTPAEATRGLPRDDRVA